MENEKWRPLLETPDQSIYQKGDKTLLVSKRGITIQTSTEIFKMAKEDLLNKGFQLQELQNQGQKGLDSTRQKVEETIFESIDNEEIEDDEEIKKIREKIWELRRKELIKDLTGKDFGKKG
mgnify:CR=1 FL=1